MEYEKLAREFRKKPIIDDTAPSMVALNYGIDELLRLLPHRHPFLFLDGIDGVDYQQRGIIGRRRIAPSDPVLEGHFPGYPILPGVLQIEMVGQLAICYFSLDRNKATPVEQQDPLPGVRALKILHALFQHEVLPGDETTIVAKVLEADDYKLKGIGQVKKGDRVCTVVIAEFYIL